MIYLIIAHDIQYFNEIQILPNISQKLITFNQFRLLMFSILYRIFSHMSVIHSQVRNCIIESSIENLSCSLIR